jgi:hypothetical protein
MLMRAHPGPRAEARSSGSGSEAGAALRHDGRPPHAGGCAALVLDAGRAFAVALQRHRGRDALPPPWTEPATGMNHRSHESACHVDV